MQSYCFWHIDIIDFSRAPNWWQYFCMCVFNTDQYLIIKGVYCYTSDD